MPATPFNVEPGTTTECFPISPDNSVNLSMPARQLYVGGGGDISLVTLQGNVVLFVNVPAGAILAVSALRVNAAGTTATALVGLA